MGVQSEVAFSAHLASSGYPATSALVLGGLGFLGSRVVMELQRGGVETYVVDSRLPDGGSNPANAMDWLEGVQTEVWSSLSDVPVGLTPSLVFNLAARTSHRGSMELPMDDARTNVSDQLAILEWLRRTCPESQVVYLSTRQVYGVPRYVPVDEDHPVSPPDVNAVNKLAAEQHHLLYGRVYGLKTTVLRLTNCFGPGMRIKDARQGFIGEWIRCALKGEPIRLFGGRQVRDFLFADDAAKAIVYAAGSPELVGGTYNVGGAESLSLASVADIFRDLLPATAVSTEPLPSDLAAIEVGDTRLDDSRFRSLTGWSPETGFASGLAATIAYYERHLEEYL
jgi:UDP-glucose 4-epimerase